jgi:hypothetical protein
MKGSTADSVARKGKLHRWVCCCVLVLYFSMILLEIDWRASRLEAEAESLGT